MVFVTNVTYNFVAVIIVTIPYSVDTLNYTNSQVRLTLPIYKGPTIDIQIISCSSKTSLPCSIGEGLSYFYVVFCGYRISSLGGYYGKATFDCKLTSSSGID